jgi:nitrous oxide reductase accessory protein NosL
MRSLKKLVINFDPGSNREGSDFLEAEKTTFWISPDLKTPMGSNAAAFSAKNAALKQTADNQGKFMSWEELYNSIR